MDFKNIDRQRAMEILEFPLVASRELTVGWWALLRQWFQAAKELVGSLSIWQVSFFAASFLTMLVSLFPWIQYHINLVGPETVSVGSNFKVFFVLPGLLGILFFAVDVPGRKWILYAFTLLAAILYGMGFLYPVPIHTRIKLRSDFQLVSTLYLYGPLLLTFALLIARGTEKSLFRLFYHLREEEPENPLRKL